MTQPRRHDEIALYARLRAVAARDPACPQPGAHMVDASFLILDIPLKRGYYLLDKWTGKGWWDYGVSLRGGWFTETAPETLTP